jgi:hypothetical protein
VAEERKEIEGMLRGGPVEMKSAASAISEIAKMALAGETYPFARRYAAGEDVGDILLGRVERGNGRFARLSRLFARRDIS